MVVTQSGVIRAPPKYNTYANSVLVKYLLSCCAATTAELVTYPLDLSKTRLQIQGEKGFHQSTRLPYRGLVRTGVGIVQEEGLAKLWQGVTPAVYRQAILGGIAIGGIAQFLASPADLVKVQMQMEGRRLLDGKPPRVRSAGEAFVKIYTLGGIRGLWKGCMPNVYRSALVNLGDLSTYDSVKHFFVYSCDFKDTYYTHALSSACSGFIGAALGTPADVVKTRVMNQPTNHRGSIVAGFVSAALGTPADVVKARVMNQDISKGLLYRSSMDCFIKTVRNEGFWALYKGFVPCWIRMGPWSLTFWLTYEQIRNLCGTSAF